MGRRAGGRQVGIARTNIRRKTRRTIGTFGFRGASRARIARMPLQTHRTPHPQQHPSRPAPPEIPPRTASSVQAKGGTSELRSGDTPAAEQGEARRLPRAAVTRDWSRCTTDNRDFSRLATRAHRVIPRGKLRRQLTGVAERIGATLQELRRAIEKFAELGVLLWRAGREARGRRIVIVPEKKGGNDLGKHDEAKRVRVDRIPCWSVLKLLQPVKQHSVPRFQALVSGSERRAAYM